jgi:SsrA-binding protein
MKIIAQNKKAFHDYEILDRIETGIVLTGDEVKSVRTGTINLVGSFAHIREGELYLLNCYIAPYSYAYKKEDDTTRRTRKLLIHRRELNRLTGTIAKKGVTLIPLKMYFNERNRVKIELGIGKHKKAHVRKEEVRERDIRRETRRELKESYR